MKYPQICGKTGKRVTCRNQDYEHRILYVSKRKPCQFVEYTGPRGPEDFASTSDEEDGVESLSENPQTQEQTAAAPEIISEQTGQGVTNQIISEQTDQVIASAN